MTQTVSAREVQAAGGLDKWAAKAEQGRPVNRPATEKHTTTDQASAPVPHARALTLELPWPPSVNHYWRSVLIGEHVRNLISADGRAYKRNVGQAVLSQTIGRQRKPILGRVHVALTLYPPDRRQRDIDNSIKAVLDALTSAKVWRDDSQVDELHVTRSKVVQGGKAVVRIVEVGE